MNDRAFLNKFCWDIHFFWGWNSFSMLIFFWLSLENVQISTWFGFTVAGGAFPNPFEKTVNGLESAQFSLYPRGRRRRRQRIGAGRGRQFGPQFDLSQHSHEQLVHIVVDSRRGLDVLDAVLNGHGFPGWKKPDLPNRVSKFEKNENDTFLPSNCSEDTWGTWKFAGNRMTGQTSVLFSSQGFKEELQQLQLCISFHQ